MKTRMEKVMEIVIGPLAVNKHVAETSAMRNREQLDKWLASAMTDVEVAILFRHLTSDDMLAGNTGLVKRKGK